MHKLLAQAIADTLVSSLEASSDRIVRVIPVRDWPVSEAVTLLAEREDLRLLLQKPFDKLDLAITSTTDAGQATGWRNSINRTFSVVVIGYAGANLDAGLHDIRVVDNEHILQRWKSLALDSLQVQGDLGRPSVQNLLDGIFHELSSRRLSASHVEAYLQAIGADGTFDSVTAEMWQLSIFQDSQVLDTDLAYKRLEKNFALVDRLRQGDEDLIRLLRKAASEHDRLAIGILNHLETGDPSLLQGIELADVERLLFGIARSSNQQTPRSLDLFALLNQAFEDKEKVRDLIGEFQDRVHESPFEPLVGTLALTDGERTEVRVNIEIRGLAQDTDDVFHLEEDPIVTAGHTGRTPPGSFLEANGRRLLLSQWVTRVNEFASSTEFVALRKRLHFLQYIPSIEDSFALLLLMPRLREDVLQYCQQWQSLVSEVGSSTAPGTRPALLSIQSLEVLLDESENPEWLALSLLHPYRLEPIARVAEFCEAALVEEKTPPEKLGDAVQWMLDRSVPAYPAFYREQSVFHLVTGAHLLHYRLHARAVLPTFSDSRGLQRALASIIRYSTWLLRGVSILVIDPPPGRGVSEALRSLRTSLSSESQLIVYHAQRSGAVSDGLTDYDGDVVYLGSDWEMHLDAIPLVDIVVLFSPESETSHMSTTESWSAAPGTHMVLQLSVSKPDDVFDTVLRPRIDVKPSSDNGIVNAIQSLFKSLSGGWAPHAALEPLNTEDEHRLLMALQKRTEWTVTARPGPFGLTANSEVLRELGYVGRAASGRYLVSMFGGAQVYAVRRYIEHVLRHTPVATVNPDDMADRLVELARDSARSLIDAPRQPVPSLGELVGLDIASATDREGQYSVSLAMDDIGWTRAWLGQKLRPDFVVVRFDTTNRSVTIRVVECKSSESSEQIRLHTTHPIITEALGQVDAAASVMTTLFQPGNTLAEDLQFSSFVEHLFAILLTTPFMSSAARSSILDLANSLAERSLTPTIERWIFVSQPSINQSRIQTNLGNATVVWLGAPEFHRLLMTSAASINVREAAVDEARGWPHPQNESTDWPTSETVAIRGGVLPSGSSGAVTQPAEAQDSAIHPGQEREDSRSETPTGLDPNFPPTLAHATGSDESELRAQEFIMAMRLHNADVADSAPRFVKVGPSLIAIGVQLLEGSSLQPIRSRLGDIAREVGLGDREKELWIENSSEPGVIQVLMPRPDREFPHLPEAALGTVRDGSYAPLYLGQTIDGTDFVSTVEKWPHMLVAGTTGSGKTTLLQTLLTQFTRLSANELEIVIADGKGDTDYLGVVSDDYFPAELVGVQLGPDRAKDVADWSIGELERRSKRIHDLVGAMTGVGPRPKAADIYKRSISLGETPPIRPLVIIIDEFADIMLASKKQVADAFMSNVQRLAQIGRSRLMHVLLATQRPDKNTIRGAVRANFDARIAMRLPTTADSMTILGSGGAEKLLNHGDFLFRASSGHVVRLQGYKM